MKFDLPNGKTVIRDNAKFCVATKTRGRWSHKWFKSYHGASNEFRMTRAHLRNPNMVAYYGLEDCKIVKGVES